MADKIKILAENSNLIAFNINSQLYPNRAQLMKAIFIETTLFEKIRSDYLNDSSYEELQSSLMKTPKAGVVIQGTGGIRKLRWAAKGKGKRSGVRVIYYWLDNKSRFYLLTLICKK